MCAISGVGTAYLPKHLSSPPMLSKVCVSQSLDLCVVLHVQLFVFLSFSHCIVFPSSRYDFWLPLVVSSSFPYSTPE
jgi:hypothetical protein